MKNHDYNDYQQVRKLNFFEKFPYETHTLNFPHPNILRWHIDSNRCDIHFT